jgi:cell wall-associated NlpC family hydrolase
MGITTDEFIDLSRSWVGVPWHHQGRSRAGVDCAGLPEAILREAGVLPDDYRVPANYGRLPVRDELLAVIEHWCRRVAVPAAGTVLSIRWPKMPGPSHVAICTGVTIIHAYRASSGVVEHSYRGRWVNWTTGVWQVPGVQY